MATRAYFRNYKRIQRATAAGFNAKLALYVYQTMRARGIYEYEARAAVLDAARDGLFGQIQKQRG
jgi:hypothetical protein